jgi:hypothetical protein
MVCLVCPTYTLPHSNGMQVGETSTMYRNITSGQPSHHSLDDGGGNSLRNIGLLSTTDMACCPRRFYWVQLPWELQVLNN